MLRQTLLAARDGSARLPAGHDVPGRLACAQWCARTGVVENSFFLGITCARLRARDSFAATAARRVNPATDAAGGASSGPCERVNPQLTGRRILEVAPYGYNLYPNPHESTAFPHATGVDPVAVRDRPCAPAHATVERDGQHRPALCHRPSRVGQ